MNGRRHTSDYNEEATERCERVLITLIGDLGPWRERIYLAGGFDPGPARSCRRSFTSRRSRGGGERSLPNEFGCEFHCRVKSVVRNRRIAGLKPRCHLPSGGAGTDTLSLAARPRSRLSAPQEISRVGDI